MADALLQGLLPGAVIHRQPKADAWNLQISHHPGAVRVQEAPIGILRRRVLPGEGVVKGRVQRLVIALGRLQPSGVVLLIQLRHRPLIGVHNRVLSMLIPQVAEHRVEQDPKSRQENKRRNHNPQNSSHGASLFLIRRLMHTIPRINTAVTESPQSTHIP